MTQTAATVHAFNHNPKMASSAGACGGQGWRGPVRDVNCPACLDLLVPVTIVTRFAIAAAHDTAVVEDYYRAPRLPYARRGAR